MKSLYICALLLPVLTLGGCGLGDLFGSGTEDMRVRGLVRDELDRVEMERGQRRREYIDERIAKEVAAQDTGAARLTALESRLGELQTDLSIVSRKVEKRIELGEESAPTAGRSAAVGRGGAVDKEELDALRGDVDAALRAVSKLGADLESRDAQGNARFERLELRTSQLDWPRDSGAQGLHLASYRTHDAALAGWEVMRTQFPELLADQEPVLVEVPTVAGLFVRLMVGPGASRDWLLRARNEIRESGEYAMIMPMPGSRVPPAKIMEIPKAPKKLVPGS
ncbi:hypothetical protein NUH88_13040 [Nisaea acidiphila]|uniref:SPOR domain-containing protein n=1 Tax=Nisaea acidiphila TaxID=1862145 RepID=A0A9J7AL10_9PROT|nr:hypothetical protein [Nisaea acidiphila]UUX48339.1 hypothetical protein NUH88_13040 [Nisaea acidiphila]